MSVIREALWRNQGQVLTPELIAGLIQASEFIPDNYIDFTPYEPVKCGNYTLQVERFAPAAAELHELHKLHWEETEKHRHGLQLNYNYAESALQDKQGRYVLFTIRKKGEMVGYCGYRMFYSAHTQTLVAEEDALFLREDCRGGRTILKFFEFMDKTLALIGALEVRVSSKVLNNAESLLKHVGFKVVATQMVKFLEVPK